MPARKPKPRRRAARKAAPPPPVAAPPKLGQPPFVPTDRQRQWVEVAAAGAVPQREIAALVGISRSTLRKAFKKELADGLTKATVSVHANFLRIATGDSKAAAWAAERWLRMRAPGQWHDQPTEIDAVVRASVVMAEPMSEEEWFREYGSSLASPGRTPTRTD